MDSVHPHNENEFAEALEASSEAMVPARQFVRMLSSSANNLLGTSSWETLSCERPEQHSHTQDSAPPAYVVWLRRLGMKPGAPQSWAQVHEKPWIPMSQIFSFEIASVFFTVLAGSPITRWKYSCPMLVSNFTRLLHLVFTWRQGVPYLYTKSCLVLDLMSFFPTIWLSIAIFTASLETAPFNNRLLCTCLMGMSIWFAVATMKSGNSRHVIPDKPYSGPMLSQFWAAFVSTFRTLDALTDMTMIRVVLEKVRYSQCWAADLHVQGQLSHARHLLGSQQSSSGHICLLVVWAHTCFFRLCPVHRLHLGPNCMERHRVAQMPRYAALATRGPDLWCKVSRTGRCTTGPYNRLQG
jgi:hypothetical protein